MGDTYWTAQNPPRGAILDYWIGEAAEGMTATVDVLDQTGQRVRRVSESTASRGVHRVVWGLRHEAPKGADGQPLRRMRGRFVLPGQYQVRLTVGDRTLASPLQVRMDPGLSVSEDARRSLDSTLELQASLISASAVARAVVDTTLAQSRVVLDSLAPRSAAPAALQELARSLESEAQRLKVVLEGPGNEGVAQQETGLPLSTLVSRLYSTTEVWTGSPTADQIRLTSRARVGMMDLLSELRSLVELDLAGLHQAMTDAGIPWPAGPAPVLPKNLISPMRP